LLLQGESALGVPLPGLSSVSLPEALILSNKALLKPSPSNRHLDLEKVQEAPLPAPRDGGLKGRGGSEFL